MTRQVLFILALLTAAVFFSILPSACTYEQVAVEETSANNSMACYWYGDPYFNGTFTLTGTANELLLDQLTGSYTLCKLTAEEKLQEDAWCDVTLGE